MRAVKASRPSFASQTSPPTYASCIHCRALVLAVEVRLGGRPCVLKWNPPLEDVSAMRRAVQSAGGDGDDHTLGLPMGEFHDCEDYTGP